MKKIVFLVSLIIPLICLASILWEDNFDSYYEGMRLGESPYWKVLFGSDYGIIYGGPQGMNGYGLLFHDGNSFYYAYGGANNPNMKVNVNIAEIADWGSCAFGVLIRVNGPEGYTLYCHKDHSSRKIESAYICYFSGSKFTSLASIKIDKEISTISIEARGKDPVYITASLDNIIISTVDNSYKLCRGYGGIFFGWQCICIPYVIFDDFIEEGDPLDRVSIETSSIGSIKAIFNK